MARSFLWGGEGGIGEAFSRQGTVTLQTSIKHGGDYALRANPSASTASYYAFRKRLAGGTLTSIARSVRVYIRIVALPSVEIRLYSTRNSSDVEQANLRLGTTGTLSGFAAPSVSGFTTTKTLAADSLWHEIQFDVGYNSGNGSRVLVDGEEWGSNNADGVGAAQPLFRIGAEPASGNVTCDIYFDDLLLDNDSFATSGFPGAGQQVLLLPASGNAANSWTGGAGGTGDISTGVNNIPPTGDATPANADQIKNAASGGNLDYTATMESYAAGGVPVGSYINAVLAICNDAEEVNTNTKEGGVWIDPITSSISEGHPGLTGNTFDFGDDIGTFGTYPSNWATHIGTVISSELNDAFDASFVPSVKVRKVSSTTRVVDVDLMGLYVDYRAPMPLSAINPNPTLNNNFNTIVSV